MTMAMFFVGRGTSSTEVVSWRGADHRLAICWTYNVVCGSFIMSFLEVFLKIFVIFIYLYYDDVEGLVEGK